MFRSWSYGRIITAGLLLSAALTLLLSGVSIGELRAVAAAKDNVIVVNDKRRLAVEGLRLRREQRAKAIRSYLLTHDEHYLTLMHDHQARIVAAIQALRAEMLSSDERRLLDRVDSANAAMQATWEQVARIRQGGAPLEEAAGAFERLGPPKVAALDEAMTALADREDDLLDQAQRASSERVTRASLVVFVFAALASIFAVIFAVVFSRVLARRVGGVIKDVEASSGELQAAANQQVESAERLTEVTAEVTTTIQELLATSRQIAESARRVTLAAEEAVAGASEGDGTVQETQEAIVGIKRQVDLIVSHMLDLDRKFQEIGAILDLIREFAEQTNILSINATIEAAGAGVHGKRFAVVADEIQRLADRVGGSTRQIYQLIDEIRSAASATTLLTEEGKKAVDSGAQKFNEVLATFKQIAARSAITNEAAREIELSTKQQTSAVEQVSLSISGVSRAARETQMSSERTLTTSGKLSGISGKLAQIVRSGAGRGGMGADPPS